MPETNPPPRVTPRSAPAAWLATGFGLCVRAPAPGTLGAALGVPLWLAIAQLPGDGLGWAAIAALVLFGVPLCRRGADQLVALGHAGSRDDPPAIVWDELSTVPIVYACAPEACTCASWLLTGFALHRLFDITKPWPCRSLERLPGGWGIMADDVAAALYAGATYATLWRWWPAA